MILFSRTLDYKNAHINKQVTFTSNINKQV